jgi:hypothetical protein
MTANTATYRTLTDKQYRSGFDRDVQYPAGPT